MLSEEHPTHGSLSPALGKGGTFMIYRLRLHPDFLIANGAFPA